MMIIMMMMTQIFITLPSGGGDGDDGDDGDDGQAPINPTVSLAK